MTQKKTNYNQICVYNSKLDGKEFVGLKYENNKVYIKLLGACVDCPMSDDTVKDMIEYTLKFEIPEIEEVINII